MLLYLWLGLGDAGQEKEVSHEEADAEVEVDGGASPLDGAAELEGEDAEDEAQQGDGQADLGDQQQAKGVLGEERSEIDEKNPQRFCDLHTRSTLLPARAETHTSKLELPGEMEGDAIELRD